jgi:hypothetical protein
VTRPVTILIRAAGVSPELESALTALLGELEWRAAGDEVLLLDSSGTQVLADWAAQRFPPPATFERAACELRTLVLPAGLPAAAALRAGAAEATHALVFLMAPGLRVGPQFLEPLCAALEDPRVFAAVPCLRGAAVAALRPRWESGELGSGPEDPRSTELDYLPPEAALLRRDELRARGFDPLFESGAWPARDLGWRARREGRAIVRVAASSAELQAAEPPAGTLAEAHARLCFTWKHLDEEELWHEHLAALLARTLRAAECGEREALVALALALEDLPALARSRPAGASKLRFRALLEGGEGHQRDA